MKTLDMKGGPYLLDEKTIDARVEPNVRGNYALGKTNENGTFVIVYIGRSDDDLNGRLKQWIGETREPEFKFSYAPTPKAAYEKECQNWHDFMPRGQIHPARPEKSDWKCSVPGCGK